MKQKIMGLALSSLFLLPFSSAQAEECSLTYSMKGWSAFYKSYKGTGVISCPSGQRANVNVSLRAGGFTFGASEITDGKGIIQGVTNINDIYGTGFAMGGHAGFVKSVEARWAPKGTQVITLSGTGRGYDLGFSLGSFKISRPKIGMAVYQ